MSRDDCSQIKYWDMGRCIDCFKTHDQIASAGYSAQVSLSDAIAAKREEIVAAGHASWPYREIDRTSGADEPAPAWQAIETAPKDGTTILVFKRTEPCWSIVGLAFWFGGGDIAGWMPYGIPQHSSEPNTLGLAHPTHWMPVPKGPK